MGSLWHLQGFFRGPFKGFVAEPVNLGRFRPLFLSNPSQPLEGTLKGTLFYFISASSESGTHVTPSYPTLNVTIFARARQSFWEAPAGAESAPNLRTPRRATAELDQKIETLKRFRAVL